ncbi:hypothetical protein KKG31_01575 [Patescibacteria group bacterium]|nr:hypothetical protein [Patescibacteria group bacterium]
MEIPRENIDKILDTLPSESSETIRDKVINARKIQQKRFSKYKNIFSNSHISSKHIQKLIPLDKTCKDFLIDAAQKLTISPRIIHRTMKLGRTIADMEGDENVEIKHLAEALQYRNKTMFIEN